VQDIGFERGVPRQLAGERAVADEQEHERRAAAMGDFGRLEHLVETAAGSDLPAEDGDRRRCRETISGTHVCPIAGRRGFERSPIGNDPRLLAGSETEALPQVFAIGGKRAEDRRKPAQHALLAVFRRPAKRPARDHADFAMMVGEEITHEQQPCANTGSGGIADHRRKSAARHPGDDHVESPDFQVPHRLAADMARAEDEFRSLVEDAAGPSDRARTDADHRDSAPARQPPGPFTWPRVPIEMQDFDLVPRVEQGIGKLGGEVRASRLDRKLHRQQQEAHGLRTLRARRSGARNRCSSGLS